MPAGTQPLQSCPWLRGCSQALHVSFRHYAMPMTAVPKKGWRHIIHTVSAGIQVLESWECQLGMTPDCNSRVST